MTRLLDFDLIVCALSAQAVQVRAHQTTPVRWLPLSQIEIEDAPAIGAIVRIRVPEWLAREKGLLEDAARDGTPDLFA